MVNTSAGSILSKYIQKTNIIRSQFQSEAQKRTHIFKFLFPDEGEFGSASKLTFISTVCSVNTNWESQVLGKGLNGCYSLPYLDIVQNQG
jgi:hypothetical protein